MPSCMINGCVSSTGKSGKSGDIIIHPFPKEIEKIKLWLQQTGQNYSDVNVLAQKIAEGNKNRKYRLCSKHFAPEMYITGPGTIRLHEMAFPSIFPILPDGENLIEESLIKVSRARKRTLKNFQTFQASLEEFDEDQSTILESSKSYSQVCDMAMQTDSSLVNSKIIFIDFKEKNIYSKNRDSQIQDGGSPIINLGPAGSTPKTTKFPLRMLDFDLLFPIKKKTHISSLQNAEENSDSSNYR